MQQDFLHTAVLLFSRTARQEAAAKPLAKGRQNVQVTTALIRNVRAQVKRSGMPLIHTPRQVEGDFGFRFQYAVQQAFEQGFENILVVGNDCPSLSVADLRHAAALLQDSPIVVGPARDGGAYLIGFSRAAFEATSWQELPWCTGELFVSLQQKIKGVGLQCQVLPVKADLDTHNDLQKVLLQKLPSLAVLKNLTQRIPDIICFVQATFLCWLAAQQGFRGPPSLR
ncbi:MAG: DUF2064 domain-containing protein [Bacteroidota bacterium]